MAWPAGSSRSASRRGTLREHANDALVELAADRLEDLLSELVFVGGAITNLLVTDPAAPPVRATRDVDVTVEVASRLELSRVEEEFRRRGFREDPEGPICRWRYEELIVDVMPTDASVLGSGNVWFGEAFRSAQDFELRSGRVIRLVPAPVFVATKLEAFKDRGGRDVYESHDLEDLISLVDGRSSIVDEVRASSEELPTYLQTEFRGLLSTPGFEEAMAGHLPQDQASRARVPVVIRRLQAMAA